MREIFFPLFISAWIVLSAACRFSLDIFKPLFLAASGLALLFFFQRYFRISYLFLIGSFSLLLLDAYGRRLDDFQYRSQAAPVCKEYCTVWGNVEDFPEIREDSSVFLLRAESVRIGQKRNFLPFLIRVKVMGRVDWLMRGDRIEIDVRLSEIHLNRNFFPNRMQNYFIHRGIHRSGFCKSALWINAIKPGNRLWRWVGSWRNQIRRRIEDRYLRRRAMEKEGVFLEATLIGDRGRLKPEMEEELIRSGVLHLIAISGANMGMLALVTLGFLRWISCRKRLRYLLTASVLLVYLALSGFDVSAQRAVGMLLLVFLARLLHLDFSILNLISFAGLVMLAINPLQVLDPGFVLTFSLTLALIWGRIVIIPLLRGFPRSLSEMVSANFSASLFAMPLSFYFFSRFSFSGLISGLLLIPLTTAVTAAGLFLLPFSLISGFLCRWLLFLLHPLLKLFFVVTRVFSGILAVELFRAPPPAWLLIVLGAAAAVLAIPLRVRLVRPILVGVLSCLLVICLIPKRTYRPGRLEVYFLDVGQGDSQVVVFPEGTGLLIDGGGSPFSDYAVGKEVILPFLLAKGIRVRWLAITHFHPDHARGAVELIPILRPREIWIAAVPDGNEFYEAVRKQENRVREICAGFERAIDGCRVRALHPPEVALSPRVHNDHSLALRICDGRHSFLFTGDMEQSSEYWLLEQRNLLLSSDVIKIAHHGSKTSSSLAFLRAVHPRLTVISVGMGNSYGFPHPDVIRSLRQLGIPYLDTARRGGIGVSSTPGDLQVEASR